MNVNRRQEITEWKKHMVLEIVGDVKYRSSVGGAWLSLPKHESLVPCL